MNLYEKLVEIRKSVEYLKKENQGHGFKFTSSSQVIMSLRESMNEHGVLLIPKVVGKEVSDHETSKGKHWYFTELIMEFEWVNAEKPEDRFTVPWYGQGLDDGEKGVGKALTYAEKYLLLKQFNIPTDKDDPDSQKVESRSKPQKAAKKQQAPANKMSLEDFKAKFKTFDSAEGLAAWKHSWWKKKVVVDLTAEEVELATQYFNAAIDLLDNPGDNK